MIDKLSRDVVLQRRAKELRVMGPTHRTVNDARDALIHYLELTGVHRAEAYLLAQAIEKFIVAKMEDR